MPLFALLRSTLGLPRDDPRWWVNQQVLSDPSVDLLERVLMGLRAWDPAADAPAPHAPGRHVLRAVPTDVETRPDALVRR